MGGEEDSLRDASKFMSCANQKKRKDFPCAISSGNEKNMEKEVKAVRQMSDITLNITYSNSSVTS
jgi:hypothetical protein